jgi:hypothetical protein
MINKQSSTLKPAESKSKRSPFAVEIKSGYRAMERVAVVVYHYMLILLKKPQRFRRFGFLGAEASSRSSLRSVLVCNCHCTNSPASNSRAAANGPGMLT